MSDKIFNLSLPKCGTTSFGRQMQLHNFNVCDGNWRDHKTHLLTYLGIKNEISTINQIIRLYESFSDLPFGGTNIYKSLIDSYHNSKFILILREDNSWFESLDNMVCKLSGSSINDSGADKYEKLFRSGCFGFSIWAKYFTNNRFDRESFLSNKKRYEEEVRNKLYLSNVHSYVCSLEEFSCGKASSFLGLPPNEKPPLANSRRRGE